MEIERPLSKQPLPAEAKRVFKGIIYDVYQWELQGYDGKPKIFEKLKRPDTVIILPVTEVGKVIIALQEQPGREPFIGTIAGRADEDEAVLETAKRELLEETGYEAREWILFDALQPVSKIEWAVYTFIAKGCKKVAEQNLDGAEKINLKLVDFDELVKIVLDSRFIDVGLRLKFLEAKTDPGGMEKLKQKIFS